METSDKQYIWTVATDGSNASDDAFKVIGAWCNQFSSNASMSFIKRVIKWLSSPSPTKPRLICLEIINQVRSKTNTKQSSSLKYISHSNL